MKNKIVYSLLALLLLSCKKNDTDTKDEAKPVIQNEPHESVSASAIPFAITVVETPETKEINEIRRQAKALLDSKDYDQLETLAAKYRNPKEKSLQKF